MLLTFIIDPPLLLFIGALFALSLPLSSDTIVWKSRAMRAGLITLTIFNVAVVISYYKYPDWMWMYIITASGFSAAIHFITVIVALLIYYFLFILGFWWCLRLRVQNKRIWPLLVLLLVASGLVIVPVADQYLHVGTTAQYLAGTAVPLPQSSLSALFNWAMGLMALVGVPLFWWAKHSR